MLVITKHDVATVALWLGHEGPKSTKVWLDSHEIKQHAIDQIAPIDTPPRPIQALRQTARVPGKPLSQT